MNLKESGITDAILPIGLLLIGWKVVSSFVGPIFGGPAGPTGGPTGGPATPIVYQDCPTGYHRIFGLSFLNCEPDSPTSSAPAQDIPFQENLPTLAMCNQVWATAGTWDIKCILAGYPAPSPPLLPENTSPFSGKPWECGVSPYLPGCL